MSADYASRALAYARQVVGGVIPASKLTIAACRRHLSDLKRSEKGDPKFPYRFCDAEANRICGLAESFPHIKGHWAKLREKIRLEDWQCFILAVSHGWLDADGYRRFRTVYIEVPRKNAKTTLSVPVALDKLTADGEQGAEVVVAATKLDQARIAFGIATSMVRKSEAFRIEFGVVSKAKQILCLETDSVLQPIDARGNTQDGQNVHFSLNDELHAWKGRELYDVLETAMGSRMQPMMWNITTAGSDQSGICYELRQYLEKILKGLITDDQFFGVIYTIDEGDDIYAESSWRKANPNYQVSVLPSDMRALAGKARNNPSSRASFKMKRLNIWINAASQYFDSDAWKACADPKMRPEDFAGGPCVGALDLASKLDVNAGIRIFQRAGKYCLFCDFWLPEAAVNGEGANASYRGWWEDGWLHMTPGNVVDYEAIEDRVADDWARRHELEQLGYDPYQAQASINRLKARNIHCVEVNQTAPKLSEPMKELDRLIRAGLIRHDGNPMMAWMMDNVVAVIDRKENVFPRKERKENKIDGPVAAIIAMALVLTGEGVKPAPEYSLMFV